MIDATTISTLRQRLGQIDDEIRSAQAERDNIAELLKIWEVALAPPTLFQAEPPTSASRFANAKFKDAILTVVRDSGEQGATAVEIVETLAGGGYRKRDGRPPTLNTTRSELSRFSSEQNPKIRRNEDTGRYTWIGG